MLECPSGVIEMAPDWVCEILSPGHDRKDTPQIFLRLQQHQTPFHWLIWPEDRALIAHRLDDDRYRVVKTISREKTSRIPPFEEAELELAYILGE